MAAISTNAIPAQAPASNAPRANDSNKAPADASPFAVVLAAANPPQQQPAPQNNAAAGDNDTSNDTNSAAANAGADPAQIQATQAAQAANDTGGGQTAIASAAQAQLEAAAQDQVDKGQADNAVPTGKPAPKSAKAADDNNGDEALQPQAAQPDPNMTPVLPVQLAAIQSPPPAANDDDSETGLNAVGSAKPSPRAAADAGKASDSAPALAGAQSPAEAAQAAINGANGKDSGQTGGDNGKADKPQVSDNKIASDKAASQTAAQPQAGAAPAAPASAALSAGSTPTQNSASDHLATASVQVTPHSAEPNLNSLAVDIAARSQSGARQFEIRLDPPELGRVDVRLSIDASGKAEAHLTADHPETLSLLQKDASTLTQALRNSGLDVSQSGLNFSLRGQNDQAGNGNDGQGRASRSNLAASRVLDAAQNASSINLTGGTGRLDIHV